MTVLHVTILLILAAVAAAALCEVWRSRRDAGRRRLISSSSMMRCGGVGHVGISVVCSDVDNMAQIENLVSPEYDNYEVVLCLDSARSAARMRHIVSRYRLLKVALPLHNDLPVVGVRAMYRTPHGAMRRVTLIDKRFTSHEDALDACVNIASFDYVTSVGRDEYLYADAVDMFAMQIGEWESGEVDMLQCPGSGGRVVSRDMAVEHGGYAGMRYMKLSRIALRRGCAVDRYRIVGTRSTIVHYAAIITAVAAAFVIVGAVAGDMALGAASAATVVLVAASRSYAGRCRRCRD